MNFTNRDVVSIRDFSKTEIKHVLNYAKKMVPLAKGVGSSDRLEGKVLSSLFFEPSTRTRLSFETAMNRLSGRVVGFADPTGNHHQRTGGHPGGAELDATGQLWAGGHQVADHLEPRFAQRDARNPDRYHSGNLACGGRDRAAGGGRGVNLYHRRSYGTLFQVHHAPYPDLPMDGPPSGRVPQYRGGSNRRLVGYVVDVERLGRSAAQSI